MNLLDVNVLLALSDPAHEHHPIARAWFLSSDRGNWATCPLVENGFIRIAGSSAYENFSGDTQEARDLLAVLQKQSGHHFLADDISLTEETRFPQLPGSRHLTDLYLLALAVHHEGKLITLDRRIKPQIIGASEEALIVLS